jgi:cold shock CspA family protein
MALDSGLKAIADTATEISFASHGGLTVLIQNLSGVDVFLGDSGVTTSTGFKLIDGQSISYDLLTDDSLYGIVATGTSNVRVTWLGR